MPDGKIYPCARFGSHNKLIVGDSCNKTWNNDNINFMNQPQICNPRTYKECNECELYLYCNAGCTFEQINNGTNGCAKPVENVCKLLKITYRETMRMTNVLKDNPLYKQMLQNIIKNVG
jgi:radical SAM protein with 4Fe4S-binding SPASM domain